jgi:hypothetical protein
MGDNDVTFFLRENLCSAGLWNFGLKHATLAEGANFLTKRSKCVEVG